MNSHLHVAVLLSCFNERHCGGGSRETALIIWREKAKYKNEQPGVFKGLFAWVSFFENSFRTMLSWVYRLSVVVAILSG